MQFYAPLCISFSPLSRRQHSARQCTVYSRCHLCYTRVSTSVCYRFACFIVCNYYTTSVTSFNVLHRPTVGFLCMNIVSFVHWFVSTKIAYVSLREGNDFFTIIQSLSLKAIYLKKLSSLNLKSHILSERVHTLGTKKRRSSSPFLSPLNSLKILNEYE